MYNLVLRNNFLKKKKKKKKTFHVSITIPSNIENTTNNISTTWYARFGAQTQGIFHRILFYFTIKDKRLFN